VDNQDLRPFHDQFWALYHEISNDRDAKNYFWELKSWSDRVVSNPSAAQSEAMADEGKSLIGRGLHIVRERYGEKLQCLAQQAKWTLQKLSDDKYAQEMRDNLYEVREAIAGSVVQTLSQLRHIAMPLFREFIAELPLPKISGSNESMNYTFDNMILKGKELGMDDLSLYMKVSTKDLVELIISVRNVTINLADIHFSYERTSMPKFADQGVCSADIHIPKFRLRWVVREQEGKNKPPKFELADCTSTFDTVNVHIEQAKHKFIDQMVLGFFAGSIKTRAKASLEESLKKQADILSTKFDKFFIEQLTIPHPKPSSSSSGGGVFGSQYGSSWEGTAQQETQPSRPKYQAEQSSPERMQTNPEISQVY